jgi:hypothetical protein
MMSWQSLLLPPKRRCGAQSTSLFLAIITGIGLLPAWSDAATPEQHLSKKTEPATAVIVNGHTLLNKNCEGLTPPALELVKAPAHGSVCFRVEQIETGAMISGDLKCKGHHVQGKKVVYVPRFGFIGTDTLQYASVSAGERWNVSIDIIVANPPGTPAPAPSDANAPPKEGPQAAGPMPACSS